MTEPITDDPRMVRLAARIVECVRHEPSFQIQVEALCTVAAVLLATTPTAHRAAATERFAAAVARIVSKITLQDREGNA